MVQLLPFGIVIERSGKQSCSINSRVRYIQCGITSRCCYLAFTLHLATSTPHPPRALHRYWQNWDHSPGSYMHMGNWKRISCSGIHSYPWEWQLQVAGQCFHTVQSAERERPTPPWKGSEHHSGTSGLKPVSRGVHLSLLAIQGDQGNNPLLTDTAPSIT